MEKTNFRSQRSNHVPTQFELFTGGKTPAFALFYNLAYFRVAGMVCFSLGHVFIEDKDQEQAIQTKFETWLDNAIDPTGKIFPKLRDYIWKGYRSDKNSDGSAVTEEDKKLIVSMLNKLREIRNFYSHIYHDNSVLEVEKKLMKSINNFHQDAVLSFSGKYPRDVERYEEDAKTKREFFSDHEGKWFFKKDARIFFLSFFLTSGEMSRFLQQCKGYKRNDNDKHHLLHKVFRFYTHRDGATRQHYGHTENMLNGMEVGEKQQTRNGQQAYKLISYINDVPLYCRDTALMPLFFTTEKVENEDKEKIVGTQGTVEDFIELTRKYDLFNEMLGIDELRKTITKKVGDFQDEVEIILDNYLEITILDTPDTLKMPFHVSKNTFHRLLLDTFRLNDKGANVLKRLRDFIKERVDFDRFLRDTAFQDKQLELYKMDDKEEYFNVYYRFKLRNEELTSEMGKLRFGKTYEGTFEQKILCTPIELDYYDFYYEQDRKIRKKDSFMYFATRYLIDFQVVGCHFMFECFKTEEELVTIKEKDGRNVKKLAMVKKRHVTFSTTFPENTSGVDTERWRLAIDNEEHIMVAFFNENDLENIGVSKKAKYKFSIGPNVMRTLLMAHLDGKRDFLMLFKNLINDIDLVRNNDRENKFMLLTPNEIPNSFQVQHKLTKQDDITIVKAKAIKHIDNQLLILDKIITGDASIKTWRRAEKNRFIMECYNYFEWNYPNDNKYKFLRKDEYKQMSIYHYCLDRKLNTKLNSKWEYENFEFLITAALQHTPDNIKEWLKDAKSFDDLFVTVAKGTAELLESIKIQITTVSDKRLKHTLSKLGFHIHEKPILSDYIPFALHPMLVLRKFYKNEMNVAKDCKNTNENNSCFILAKKFRADNLVFEKKLPEENYNTENYIQCIENEGITESKGKKHKLRVTAYNEKIQDIIIAKMADKYLSAINPNYTAFGLYEADWQVKGMRGTFVKQKFQDTVYGNITLSIRFHQLDDFLLVESKSVIAKAIHHVLERFEHYSNKQMEVTKTEDGYEIPYEEVFKEIQRVHNNSLRWATHLLEWERSVVETNKQNAATLSQKPKGKAHLNFKDICDLANIQGTERKFLNELRKNVFHTKIPSEYTYWELAKTEKYVWLRKLLKYNDIAIAEKYK